MKRKEIWVGVIIDTEEASDAFDDAYIFNSREEAVNWARECKEIEEEEKADKERVAAEKAAEKERKAQASIYIGRISTAIDYARSSGHHRGTKCPIGPQGIKGVFTNDEVLDIMKLIIHNIQTIIVEEGIDYAKE